MATATVYDTRTDGAWAADEREGGRWVVICDPPHSGLVQETNKRRAQSLTRCPEEWCPDCQDEATSVRSSKE